MSEPQINRWKIAITELVVFTIFVHSTHAALTWDASAAGGANPTDGSGSWLAANQWSDGVHNVTWANYNDAIIGNGGTGSTIDLGASTVIVNSLTFNNVIAPGYYLTNGTVSLVDNGTINPNAVSTPTIDSLHLLGTGTINCANESLNLNGLSGSGTLTLNGAGNWMTGVQLDGDNTNFTGEINMNNVWLTVTNAVTNDLALGSVPGVYTPDAVTMNDAFLDNPGATTLAIAANRGITITGGGIFRNDGGGTITLNSPITGSSANYVIFWYGNFNLNMTNSYAAMTQPWAADLTIGVDNVLPYGTGGDILHFKDWDTAGSIVDLNGHTLTVDAVESEDTAEYFPDTVIDNTAAGPATLVVGAGDGSCNANGYVGIIQNTGGPLSLVKIGVGTQVLAGENTYTGDTTVNGGTLEIVQNLAIATNSTVTITNGAVLQLDFSGLNQVGALVLNGVSQPMGVYNASTPGGYITGPGSLLVPMNTNPPAAPTGLTATAGNAQVSLSWNASSGATSYNVKRSTNSGGPYTIIASPTTTSYVNTGLTNGTTYYYVVSALNGDGESANSTQISATPTLAQTVYVLDFGGGSDATELYLLEALQGLVNRDQPRLFLSNDEYTGTPGAGNKWVQYLQTQKGYTIVRLNSLNDAINTFKGMNGTNGQALIQGLVKYQPITWNYHSNNWNDTYYEYWIAANYAAQSNLLPVTSDILANQTQWLSTNNYWYVDSSMTGWADFDAGATWSTNGLAVTPFAGIPPGLCAVLGAYQYKWVDVNLTNTPIIEITVSGLSSGGQWGFAINMGSSVNLYANQGTVPIFTNKTTTGVFTFNMLNSGLFNPTTGHAGLEICPMTTNTTVTISKIEFLNANGVVPATNWYTPPANEFSGLNIVHDLTNTNLYPQMANEAAACAWSVTNQLPLCNSNSVDFEPYQNGSAAISYDLDEAIANKTYIFEQESVTDPFDQPPDVGTVNYSNIMSRLTPPARVDNWPENWDEDIAIAYFAEFGARSPSIGDNFSFWERVPTNGIKLPQVRQVTQLGTNFYINFTQASGDSLSIPTALEYSWWFDPARGQIPNSWGIDSGVAELAPAMVEYYASTASNLDSFFTGPEGSGYAHPGDMTASQQAAFGHITRVDMQALGESPAVDWCPGFLTAFTQTNTDSSQPIGLFTPLNRFSGMAFTEWQDDGTPMVYPDVTLEDLYFGDSVTTPATLASKIQAVAAEHPEGGPYFITCNVRFSPTFYQQTMALLNTNEFKLVGTPDFIALAQEAGGFTVRTMQNDVGAGDTVQAIIELHNADGTTGGAGTIGWTLPSGWTANQSPWVHGTVPQRGVLKEVVSFTAPSNLTNGATTTLVFTNSLVNWVRQLTLTNCAQGQTITSCSSTNGWTLSGGAHITLTNAVGLTNGMIRITPQLVQRRSDYLAGSQPASNGQASYSLGSVNFSQHPLLEVNLNVGGQNSFNTVIGVVDGSSNYYWLDSESDDGVYTLDLTALTGLTGTQSLTLQINPCTAWGPATFIQDVRLYYINQGTPPTPTGLTAAAGNAQVSLTWTASSGATSYHVGRSTTSGGPYTTVASPTTTSYVNTGLTNGTTYYYVVSAANSSGTSPNSAQVQVQPVSTSPPTLNAQWSANSLQLSWPADHLGWMVQSNSVNVAVPADWYDISNTATGTNYNITIDPTQKTVFYRLVYP